jgi:tetratricopeptide (TPR) repeat protein
LKEAFDLKDRASEKERLYIAGHYYDSIGDLEQSLQTWQFYQQTYPNDEIPYSNLAVMYGRLGDFEKDLKYSLDGIRIDPDSGYGYLNASWSYNALGRFEEAKAISRTALQKFNDSAVFHATLALTAMMEGDEAAEQKEAALSSKDSIDYVRFVLPAQTTRAAGHGQLRKAQEFATHLEELSQRDGLRESQALTMCGKAQMRALLGDKSSKKIDDDGMLKISDSPSVKYCLADTYALSENDSAALKLADELSRQRPHDTWLQSRDVPTVKARVELNHGNGAKALELLKSAPPYAKADAEELALHGQAYLLNHQPREAEAMLLQAIKLQHEGLQDPNAWLAQVYLARAYAAEGDTAKARTAYQDFFATWKDADPGLPLLGAAKAEYAKLQ